MIEIKEKIPVMTYSQYRRARKLVHQCCNYESGNCLALDDGEEIQNSQYQSIYHSDGWIERRIYDSIQDRYRYFVLHHFSTVPYPHGFIQ